MKERILTGIKPTGLVHIGNYFGAIKPAIELSMNENFDCFYFIADYHALTTVKSKEDMLNYTYNLAATWLACGLDPDKILFYKQSDVPEILELNWILSNLTPKGLMNRAHAYKACVEKNIEQGIDKDNGVNMGLYNYPILMASDILIFDSNKVPVGQDQLQHIEIARDIANYFNNTYKKTFVLPEGHTQEETSVLVGLDGRKMSKSYNNYIQLFSTEKELQKQINRIVTDSRMPGEPKDLECSIYKIYKLFATNEQTKIFANKLLNGLGWGDAKKELFEVANAYISPMREKFNYFISHKEEIDRILENGAEKARTLAKRKLDIVKKTIGVTK